MPLLTSLKDSLNEKVSISRILRLQYQNIGVFIKKFLIVEQSRMLERQQWTNSEGWQKLFNIPLVFDKLYRRVCHLRVVLLPNIIHQDDENNHAQYCTTHFENFAKNGKTGRHFQIFHFAARRLSG